MNKNKYAPVITLNCMIILLGLILVTEFYAFLLSQTNWIAYLSNLGQYVPANSMRYALLSLLKNSAPYSYLLFLVGLLLSALACIALYARFYTCLLLSFAFFIVWILQWNVPGVWPYQFLFPAGIALLAGLSSTNLAISSQPLLFQLGFSFFKKIIVISVVSCFLYYVSSIAFMDEAYAHQVGVFSGLTFFIACIASNSFQKQACVLEKDEQGVIDRHLDYMVLLLGSMLVMQVYANYFSSLFELNDFKASLIYYGSQSNARWLHGFLLLSADYSQWILPFYMVFEIVLALSLSLLLFRGPVLLLTGILLGILGFAELGISSTWPPTPNNLTWQWLLLPSSLVAFMIGIEKTWQLSKHFSFKYMILGDSITKTPMSLLKIILIPLVAGLGLYLICMFTQVFGESYKSTAIFSGISFALLVFILLITDKYRRSSPGQPR